LNEEKFKSNKETRAKDVLPNINRTQGPEYQGQR